MTFKGQGKRNWLEDLSHIEWGVAQVSRYKVGGVELYSNATWTITWYSNYDLHYIILDDGLDIDFWETGY